MSFGVDAAKDRFGNTRFNRYERDYAFNGPLGKSRASHRRDRMAYDRHWFPFKPNLIFKLGIVTCLGNPKLRKQIGIVFGLAFSAGVLVVILWPS